MTACSPFGYGRIQKEMAGARLLVAAFIHELAHHENLTILDRPPSDLVGLRPPRLSLTLPASNVTHTHAFSGYSAGIDC